MSSLKIKQILFFQLVALLFLWGSSCNSKTEDDETEIVVTPAIVAVKSFSLKSNDSVMAHLDSVFFSIDLTSGVIFNADSLPKGTDVSRLIPSITFANTMTQADLIFYKDDDTELTTVNYLTNPTDTIDFSSPVRLDVTAQDGKNTFSYIIKVNVHEENPDTVVWNKMSKSPLPSRGANPVAQKTIMHEGTAYCIVMEANDEYTISTCSDLNEGVWQTQPFNPGFYADPESFTSVGDVYYITDLFGELYTSEDLKTWSDTGEKWINVIGAYGNVLLGVKLEAENYLLTQYPKSEGYQETKVPENFPIYHSSSLGIIETKWAEKPMAIMACGLTIGGLYQSDVWAFDGENWAIINSTSLPALEKPMLTRYVVYRDTTYLFTKRVFDIWLLFGGCEEDGTMNRTVYMSYDNGVNWIEAPVGMQLPESFPDLLGADVITAGYDLSADLSEAWSRTPDTRGNYTIDGYDITWVCPYLYIFGGYNPYPDNSLNTTVYRGVLQRLTFTPSI